MRIAQSWRRGWPAVPAAALLYGVWALFGASAESDRVAAAPSSTVAAANPMAASLADAPAAPAAELAASSVAAAEATDALPPGVTREQWAAIEAEVSKRPDAPAELQRLHAYLQWSDALRRFREAPAADRAALAATALALGRFFLDHRARIRDIEINPLMVRPAGEGAVAVDVRVLWREDAEGA